MLADASIAIGSLSLEAGPGARVREAPIFVKAAGEVYAGFALEVFRAAQDAAAFVLEDDGASVAVGERRISAAGRRRDAAPSRALGAMARAAPSPPPMSSTARSRRSAWPGRIVLIGSSAPEAGALLATAADPLTPTVQLQAEAVEELRAGHSLEPVAAAEHWSSRRSRRFWA